MSQRVHQIRLVAISVHGVDMGRTTGSQNFYIVVIKTGRCVPKIPEQVFDEFILRRSLDFCGLVVNFKCTGISWSFGRAERGNKVHRYKIWRSALCSI